MSAAANRNRSWRLLAFALVVGFTGLMHAQLPPPDLLLKEPKPAVLVLGAFDVHIRAAASFFYDDNINLNQQPVDRNGIVIPEKDNPPEGEDFIFTFSPGLRVAKAAGLEDSHTALSVDYSPTFIFFLKNDSENAVDHAVKFSGGYALTKLTLNVAQDWTETSGGVVDVGTRVNRDEYRTAVGARYEMSEKTFLLVEGSYRITDYETQTDSEEWSVSPTANYQFSPKISLGLGVSYGETTVAEQSSVQFVDRQGRTNTIQTMADRPQTIIGPTLRATYKTTDKTDLSFSVGGEFRDYEDGSTSFGLVFSLVGTYRPWDKTSFSIEAHRREQPSAVLNGQDYVSTGASISARQQLRDRLSGYASVNFDNNDYKATQRGVNATRNDDYFLLRYGLDAILGRSWTIGVFHQYREDVSSEKAFSFSNNQVGIQAAWAY